MGKEREECTLAEGRVAQCRARANSTRKRGGQPGACSGSSCMHFRGPQEGSLLPTFSATLLQPCAESSAPRTRDPHPTLHILCWAQSLVKLGHGTVSTQCLLLGQHMQRTRPQGLSSQVGSHLKQQWWLQGRWRVCADIQA